MSFALVIKLNPHTKVVQRLELEQLVP